MKKSLAFVAILVFALVMAACAGGGGTPTAPPAQAADDAPAATTDDTAAAPADDVQDEPLPFVEITVPHYKTGDNVGAMYFLPRVERFNERYEGRFRINVEPIPQGLYGDQIQQLAAQRMLPPLVFGPVDRVWFTDVVISQDMFVDLTPVYERAPALRNYMDPRTYDYNVRNGQIVSMPTIVQRPIGMYYNRELWTPSRRVHDMSWRDVAAELDGAHIAFMTAENSWTTVLPLTSLIAVEPGGAQLLTDGVVDWITDFNQPPLIAAFGELQYLLMNHAQPNAIGAPYAEAANSFFNLGSAIISNGSWMIGDILEGQDSWWGDNFNPDTIGGTVLPGNVAVGGDPFGFGYWIPSTATPEEVELAMAYMVFMMETEELEAMMLLVGGSIPGFTHTQEFLTARGENRLMAEYQGAIDGNTIIVPNFLGAVVPSIAEHDLGVLLPLLANGTMTPEEFAEELTLRTEEAAEW